MVFGGHSSVDSLYKQDIWEWSGTDATLTNRTTGGTKPRRRATRPAWSTTASATACCCSAATAPRRLRRSLGLGSPTTQRLDADHPYRRAADGALRHLDVLRRRSATRCTCYGQNWGGYAIWEYDPALNTWKDRTVTSPPAGVSRSYFDVAFDSTAARSSCSAATTTASTTRTSGSGTRPTGVWAQADAGGGHRRSPTAATTTTVAYDSIRRVLVLVGGHVYVTGMTPASTIRGSGTRTCRRGTRPRRRASSRRRATST